MHFLRTTTIAIALAFLLGCGGGGTPVMDTGPGDSGADADKRDLVKPEIQLGRTMVSAQTVKTIRRRTKKARK